MVLLAAWTLRFQALPAAQSFPARRGLVVIIQRAMFQLDAGVGEVKVGTVLAMAAIRGWDGVAGFIAVSDAVGGLPVGVQQFLVAFDQFALDSAELLGFDELVVGRVVIFTVIPAQAGIYACRLYYRSRELRPWIPAKAGITVVVALK